VTGTDHFHGLVIVRLDRTVPAVSMNSAVRVFPRMSQYKFLLVEAPAGGRT
jgi:hypothetical protein